MKRIQQIEHGIFWRKSADIHLISAIRVPIIQRENGFWAVRQISMSIIIDNGGQKFFNLPYCCETISVQP